MVHFYEITWYSQIYRDRNQNGGLLRPGLGKIEVIGKMKIQFQFYKAERVLQIGVTAV